MSDIPCGGFSGGAFAFVLGGGRGGYSGGGVAGTSSGGVAGGRGSRIIVE